jgi:flagellar hook-associated protein 2
MPIDGLVSGLDTSSIIKQLMDVERAPQVALNARKATITARLDAFSSIRSRLANLGSAATALSRPSDWSARAATASSDAVTVSATSAAAIGSLSFTVDALASAHSLRSGNTIASAGEVIAGGGSIEITNGAGTHTVNVGSGTLTEVVAAVNAAGLGIRAAAVNTGSGLRLQLTAVSGAANAFTVSAGLDDAVGGTVVATAGADARLTIGSGAGSYQVTSSSNTFANLTDGLTVTARRADPTTPVTVDVADDVDALVARLQRLVDSANSVLSEVATRTAYDAAAKKGSSLAGDATVRRLAQDLSRAVAGVVVQGSLSTGGAAGLGVDRFGKVTFDAGRFRTAYAADPIAVQRLFVQGATTTGSVTFVSAGARAVAGSHEVAVTALATPATATDPGTFPADPPPTIRVRIGATVVEHTPLATDGAAQVAAGLQAAADGAGFALAVSAVAGDRVAIATMASGSLARFSVAWDGAAFTDHAGTDVSGTIGGVAATGVGDVLTVPVADPTLGGLSVLVPPGVTGTLGTIDYVPGIAQRLASVVAASTDASGYVTTAEEGGKRRVTEIERSVAAYDLRLAARERRLRAQFSSLEESLGRMRNQSEWLAGQIAGIRANSRSGG